MDIVLHNNLILVTTNFTTLDSPWMRDFLNLHVRGMLFLPKAVLVFKNETLQKEREEFLHQLSQHHAQVHDFDHKFFLRSMLKYTTQPIKIELHKLEKPQKVRVHLYAYDKNTVLITLDSPNAWVTNYMRSQLEVYVERGTDISLVVDVSDMKAKARLNRTLNKKHILHYNIEYTFDNHFLSKLYGDYAHFSFGDLVKADHFEAQKELYSILECPVGASKELIKRNYKKLTKVYHPDKVYHESPHMVAHYTQKFQRLQEAYKTLRAAS